MTVTDDGVGDRDGNCDREDDIAGPRLHRLIFHPGLERSGRPPVVDVFACAPDYDRVCCTPGHATHRACLVVAGSKGGV